MYHIIPTGIPAVHSSYSGTGDERKKPMAAATDILGWVCSGAKTLYSTIKDYGIANTEAEDLAHRLMMLDSMLQRVPTEDANVREALDYVGKKLDENYTKVTNRLQEEKSFVEKAKDYAFSSSFRSELASISWEIHVATTNLQLALSVSAAAESTTDSALAAGKIDDVNFKVEQLHTQMKQVLAAIDAFKHCEKVEQGKPDNSPGPGNDASPSSLPRSSFLYSMGSLSMVPKVWWDYLTCPDGQTLSQENLEKWLIAKGGFGYVCKATLKHVGDVAVKILDIDPSELTGKKYKQFKRECVTQYRASTHPHVVSFFGLVYEPTTNVAGMVMNLAYGGSLYNVINEDDDNTCWTELPTRLKLRSLSGLLSAVSFMHSVGVIHADLKPHNVLLAERMRDATTAPTFWVSDFGLSKTSSSVMLSKGSTLARSALDNNDDGGGTIGYMAPETVTKGEVTKKSDVFSLAITIWSALACEEPFKNVRRYGLQVCENDVRPSMGMLCEDIPDTIKALLRRAWDPDPTKRPTADEFFDEWERALLPLSPFFPNSNATAKPERPSEDIFTACENGDLDVVRLLVEEFDEDPEQTNDDGKTPIFDACEKGHLDVVIYLVEECKADVHTIRDKHSKSPIFYACDHVDVVKYLVEDCKVDVHTIRDNYGRTPIFKACWKGHLDVVKYLVEQCKVDVHTIRDKYGKTPVDVSRPHIKEYFGSFEQYQANQ